MELAAELNRHQRAVNVVRWSPNGEFLASGDDEAVIFLWQLKVAGDGVGLFDEGEEQDKETWLIYKTLRGHLEDVYDLAWSPNSMELLSGSVDNTAIVWDAKRGKSRAILNDHKGFVQGVAWDPKSKYLATLSTDRYFRLFNAKTYKVFRRLSKARYPVDKDSPWFEKTFRLFHDDTLPTFNRRLCFSPDGELIILPSGLMEDLSGNSSNNNVSKPMNTTYIFTRYNTKTPAVILPAMDQYTVAVRCCPQLFTLRPSEKTPVIGLPYRVILAIATKSSVYFYDTQQKMPFALISNIHYARLTDLTWSSDGNTLIVSSADGFCTLITFEDGELGDIYKPEEIEDFEMDLDEDSSKDSKDNEIKTESPDVKLEKDAVPIEIQIPETIIATTNQFESPEYKSKPATPIAIRRVPRNTDSGSSPSMGKSTSKPITPRASTPTGKTAQQTKVTRHIGMVKTAPPEQEEALDSWPKPIDQIQQSVDETNASSAVQASNPILVETTQDMRLVYEGDSELTTMKTMSEDLPADGAAHTVPIDLETVTPDSKSTRTPRRVELRTLSTPKAKKKIL